MEEEALQLDVRVIIQPVRASCAVCASRLNANYLQDVTLFSGPLRHDVHLCVHRHYNECWAKHNSHGVKMKETVQTNTHVLFPLQPTTSGISPMEHDSAGGYARVRTCVSSWRRTTICMGTAKQCGTKQAVLMDWVMKVCSCVSHWLVACFDGQSLACSPEIVSTVGVCFPALCRCCWSAAATASWQTRWSVAHKLILHDWAFNIQLWPTGD